MQSDWLEDNQWKGKKENRQPEGRVLGIMFLLSSLRASSFWNFSENFGEVGVGLCFSLRALATPTSAAATVFFSLFFIFPLDFAIWIYFFLHTLFCLFNFIAASTASSIEGIF